jgi:endo-1,4-beta-xylanase
VKRTLALILAICCGLALAHPSAGLRDLAGSRIRIGAAVDEDALSSDPVYRETLAREYDSLTPENAIKFEVVHPAPFRYDFHHGDALVAFAVAHRMQVHGHVLVWHEQLPTWLTQGHLPADAVREALRQHIQRVVGHYRGRVAAWDVVSEAIADDGSLRDTFWLQALGPEYIELAFQWAHEADPEARLYYNDYGGESLGPKSDAIYRLVRDLRARQIPIDGVGLQMHLSTEWNPPPADVAANMARLAALGLEANVTEMDVRMKLPPRPVDLAAQAQIYRGILESCLAAPNCREFTTWGLSDHHSWIPQAFPGWGAALPFDEEYRPKPAYLELAKALEGRGN